MLYTLVVLKIIADIARSNGGVVRPIQVERAIKSDEDLSSLGITRHKVRQLFKECKADGLLHFDGHQYVWRETHWLNYAGLDVMSSMGI